jgi:hypothetical protein
MKKNTQYRYQQNRLLSIKKISFFVLFALMMLNFSKMSAQICDSFPYTVNYISCNGAAAPLTITYVNTGITYTFKLDSVVSTTNSWQNVRNGYHTISYTGSNGCVSRTTFRSLYSTTLQVDVRQQTRASCSDTTTKYRIDVFNGQAPYTFRIDGGAPTTNNVVSLRDGWHNIVATDAGGCRSDSTYGSNRFFEYRNDSIPMRYTFVANNSCDSAGTLSLNPDASLSRPFTVSLNGRPFVSDSVFRNIGLLNGFNTVLFKSAVGCIYQNRFIYFHPVGQLNYNINYSSCGQGAPLSINYFNATSVYTFRLDGVASSTNTWQNVLPGRHKRGYTSSNGCSRPDFDITLDASNNLQFYTYELIQQQRTCVDTVRPYSFYAYNGTAPYTFTINGTVFSSSNIVANLHFGSNNIIVQDANGCRINTSYFANFAADTAFIRQTFVPNRACDSIGTVKISLTDLNAPRPLSISLDGGGTFTADTVLRNVNIYTYIPQIIVKSAQGCSYKAPRINYSRLPQKLNFYTYYESYCNAPGRLYVELLNNNLGTTPYVLRVDGQTATTPNNWENIAPGRRTIKYALEGCSGIDTAITLTTLNSLSISVEQQQRRNCLDTVNIFKLKVIGGRPPYTFRIDNGAITTDTIVALGQGAHYIDAFDATGCTTRGSYHYINYRQDSVATVTTYTPNSACDTLGTLKISVIDPRIARPFTISLNGGAFTSDTIFRNLANYRGAMNFVVRSAQGCLYDGYTNTPNYTYPLPFILIRDSTCANRLGFGDVLAFAFSWSNAPLTYRWSNGTTSQNLTNVRIGTYTLTVTDSNTGCFATKSKTFTTCVWAGDTDTSGVVNSADLLNIGLAFGERGQSRIYCDSAYLDCLYWRNNNTPDWSKQTPTKVNYKHIDADGNGIINHKDTLAITLNWQKTHTIRGNGNPVALRGAAPPIYVQTGRVVEGQWASFPIMLGDPVNAANGIYGLTFSINYDASVIDASTVYLTYNQNWLGNGDNVLRISKNFNGSIEAAISRVNQQNASGNGQIATLNFRMKAGTMGKNVSFTIDNQQVINKDAQPIPIVPTPTSTSVLSGTSEPDWARQIEVFPNPTTGNVHIEGQNLAIKSVEVLDISGKSLLKLDNIGNGIPLSIEHAGTYFLKIKTEKGVLMRKLVRL